MIANYIRRSTGVRENSIQSSVLVCNGSFPVYESVISLWLLHIDMVEHLLITHGYYTLFKFCCGISMPIDTDNIAQRIVYHAEMGRFA